MTNMILKNDNADNNVIAAIQAGFASVNANLQGLAAANGDILRELKSSRGNQRGCGCCCCGGGRSDAAGSRDIVYAVGSAKDVDGKTIVELASYHQPLQSQAEADAVNVIVYLGGSGYDPILFNNAFTLDGFAMPGNLQIDFLTLNSYPCTLLRKKDRSGWVCLNRQNMVHMDWNIVSVYVDESIFFYNSGDPDKLLCCGLYRHNCRGKVFTAQIHGGENWTEEHKSRTAYFTVKEDTIYYYSFPEVSDSNPMYRQICVTKDYESGGSSWGELIEKYGNKPFGVRVPADGMFLANAFAIN